MGHHKCGSRIGCAVDVMHTVVSGSLFLGTMVLSIVVVCKCFGWVLEVLVRSS